MIIKIQKIINNKYSRFFKFIFFIRYLLLIFFLSVTLFLLIPNFFDYKKKSDVIRNTLHKNFGITTEELDNIHFKSFPVPHFKLNNLVHNFTLKKKEFISEDFEIYPKLTSIYNFNNFEIKKIKIKKSKINLNLDELKILTKNILSKEKKINLQDLGIYLTNKETPILNLKKINFSNYGYKKNIIEGEVFNKKFKIKLFDNKKKIDFKLFKSGVSAKINFANFNETRLKVGALKAKILDSNLKFDFIYNKDTFKINNSFYRSRDLAFDSDGLIELKPFFKLNLSSTIKNFNLKNINLNYLSYLLNSKDLIKKINLENEIIFNSKKFSRDLIDNLNIKTNLAYGRMFIEKEFSISQSFFQCDANVNLVEEFPVLNFECQLLSKNKRELLKKLKIKNDFNNKELKLRMRGNLNVINKKINFDYIQMDNTYKASKEDLNFFKKSFENTILDEGFLSMFQIVKLRDYLNEIL